jgi:hypothetical protein
MFIVKLLLMIIFPFALYADTCFVASGQTVAFDLSAGSKASWNNTRTGVRQLPDLSMKADLFSVFQLSNGYSAFKIPGFSNGVPLTISLYSVNGRKVGSMTMHGRTIGEFRKRFMPGIYFARLDVAGTIRNTTRFMVGR